MLPQGWDGLGAERGTDVGRSEGYEEPRTPCVYLERRAAALEVHTSSSGKPPRRLPPASASQERAWCSGPSEPQLELGRCSGGLDGGWVGVETQVGEDAHDDRALQAGCSMAPLLPIR